MWARLTPYDSLNCIVERLQVCLKSFEQKENKEVSGRRKTYEIYIRDRRSCLLAHVEF